MSKNLDSLSIEDIAIPEGAEPLVHQVAGHRFGISKPKLGLLHHSSSGDILKPIYDKRSERENKFYELCFSKEAETDICIRELRSLIPKYNGKFYDPHMKIYYIRLEDQTKGLRHSAQLDTKIGRITYDPEATPEKIKSELGKYKYTTVLGFRILGMRFFDRICQNYVIKEKAWGTQVTPETATQAFLTFVQNDINICEQYVQQLDDICHWFREKNIYKWKFISSSLLFVYGEEQIITDNRQHHCKALIKMIDFAHVFSNQLNANLTIPETNDSELSNQNKGIDYNYLFGIEKIYFHFSEAINIIKQNKQ